MTGVSHRAPSSPLVSAEWLMANRTRPDLIVLDARITRSVSDGKGIYGSGHASFGTDGHIPGALFADLFLDLSDPDGRFLFTRPKVSALAGVTRALGVDTDSTVVVYDSLNGVWASRVWWVLKAYGLERVCVLEGGLGAWQKAGGALEYGMAIASRAGNFVPTEQAGYFVDVPQVRAVVEGQGDAVLLCGTQRAEFTGSGSDDPRRGHIPGSMSLPYAEILTADGHLDLAHLKAETERLGVKEDDEIILYCGGGINAAGLALGLTANGLTHLTIFDGSLNEWKADPTLPMETGNGRDVPTRGQQET